MNITTARLHLRDLHAADLAAMHAFKSDPEIDRFTDFASPSLVVTQEWLAGCIYHNHVEPRVAHNCAIVLRATQLPIGWIGFGRASAHKRMWGELDFGYALRRDYWGQGYMTEALRGMFDFIFTALTAETIFGECNVGNMASARVMEKAGMVRVARYANPTETTLDKAESFCYQMRRSDWLVERTPTT